MEAALTDQFSEKVAKLGKTYPNVDWSEVDKGQSEMRRGDRGPVYSFAQTRVSLAPLRARAAHIVQLGTISLIDQRRPRPPILGEQGAQFQSRVGET
jgi:hypothetical protein